MKIILHAILVFSLLMPHFISADEPPGISGIPNGNPLYPPVNLIVDPGTLEAEWLPPGAAFLQLDENWSSADFAINEWTFDTVQGNWLIDTLFGNPEPSARFEWTPALLDYSHALVSKELNGIIMPNVQLQYDVNLINWSTSTLEQLAVEIWNGETWIEIANYNNAGGNIPWTTYTHDISTLVTDLIFRVRFRAYGVNSASIDWWSIDNIKVYADISGGDDEELLGYYVYLDDAIVTFTEETSYSFNPQNFNYGQSYVAAVRAAYDEGLSAPATFAFVSEFLYKPCDLQGSDINHAVSLSWEAPGTCEPGGIAIPTEGFNIHRDNSLIATVDSQVFSYVDEPLVAGIYSYAITALYIYNDTLIESLPEGPINVSVAPGPGFVVGTITDSITGDSIAGVIVSAGIYNTYSLEDGSYWLVAAEGVYDMVFNKPGYALHVVEDFTIAWQQTQELDVELTPSEPNIPFEEDWSSGEFETNGWTFEPEQGNWIINNDVGNPEPSAEFNYLPAAANYSYSLVSQEFDARDITIDFYLQFDLQLDNYASTGTEKMRVDIWNGSQWIELIEFSNTSHLAWTRHFIDVAPYVAGQFTRIRFVAYGLNTYNIDSWRIDNIRLDLVPSIAVNPTWLHAVPIIGYILTKPLAIYNNGMGLLNFDIGVEIIRQVPEGESFPSQNIELGLDPNPIPGGEPATNAQENEVILHYDGPNNDAIGLTAGGTFHTAARFPASMVGQYAGYMLESVDIFISGLPSNVIVKVWGASTTTSPGELLHEQFFNPVAQSWNTINLDSDVILDGNDLWVGYQVTHAPGVHPAGVDAGPANPNGDWISIDGVVWEHLAGYGLDQNFNIRAKINSTELPWLSVDPTSGSVEAGSSKIVDVIFNATNVGGGSYEANLNISSNDPQLPLLVVPVYMDIIINKIPTVNLSDWANFYPVPGKDRLNIDFNLEVSDFRIINQMGQIVLSRQAEGKEAFIVDVSHLPNGLYFLQADAKDGRVYSRKILISR
jgi:hypothetical protein